MSKFRDWLEKQISEIGKTRATPVTEAEYQLCVDILKMHDVFTEEQKFKVGDRVILVEDDSQAVVTDVVMAYKVSSASYPLAADELKLAKKVKHVFSLEKWIDKRMKEASAKYVADNIKDMLSYAGKTREQIGWSISEEEDLFVEVDA